MRKLLIALLSIFLLVPNAVAAYLWSQSGKAGKIAALVAQDTGGFSATAPFVAEGKLHSPSGATVKSKQLEKDCLLYETRVYFCETVKDSDGEDEDKSSSIFDEREQVDDLQVVFDGQAATLDGHQLAELYLFTTTELDDFPQYVPFEPSTSNPRHWYSATEAAYPPEQPVTVIAKMEGSALAPHPQAESLIVYPGSRQEFLAHQAQSGKTYKIIALAMVAMSIVGVAVCGLVLKFAGKGEQQ